MAELSGTNLAGSIVPFTTDDTFATHLAKFGKGGWRSVANIAERDVITADRREAGMAVYVIAEKKLYILADNLTSWTELDTDSGYTKDEIDGLLAAIEAQISAQTALIDGKADKTDIPTQVSQLENDSGYITQADLEDVKLPDQTGNNGKFLMTDGANTSWEKVNDYTAGEGLVLSQPFENDDYKQIEYIESTGDIYVDTGVLDNPNYEYKARFQPTNIDKSFSTLFGYLAGNVTSAPSRAIRIEVQDGVKSIAIGYTDDGNFAGKMYTAGAMDELAWHNVSYNKTSVELDGATLLEFNPYPDAFPAKMVLFGAWVGYSSNPSGSDWSYRTQYAGKVSSFEVYENTDGTPVLIHNFIPVKSKTTDEAGFYDTINDTFHTVVSSVEQATWQQGPESAIVIELERPVPQVSLNAGKFLTNDGKKLYWADVASGGGSAEYPDQTDNAGKFLMTDGENVSWQKAIQNNATADTGIAIGNGAQATYDNSVAIGNNSGAFGTRSIAIGQMAYVYKFGGTDQIVIGPESRTISDYAIAIGTKAIVKSDSIYGIAIGYQATVENQNSIAFGVNSKAIKSLSVAIGYDAKANDHYCNAIGYGSRATGYGSTQIGIGENTEAYSLKFREHTIIRTNGTIPYERLSTSIPENKQVLMYDEDEDALVWGEGGGGSETAGTEVIIRRWN